MFALRPACCIPSRLYCAAHRNVELSPADMLPQAVRLGSEAIAVICTAVEGWAAEIGAPKRADRVDLHLELDQHIEVSCYPDLRTYEAPHDKSQKYSASWIQYDSPH